MSYVSPETAGLAGVYNKSVEVRARFITRTYAHLFGAIIAFTAIELRCSPRAWRCRSLRCFPAIG
jgi:hypothetical protein